MQIVAKTGMKNKDLLMETYCDAIASYTLKKAEEKWKHKLSEAEDYNCIRKLIPYVRDSEVMLKSES